MMRGDLVPNDSDLSERRDLNLSRKVLPTRSELSPKRARTSSSVPNELSFAVSRATRRSWGAGT